MQNLRTYSRDIKTYIHTKKLYLNVQSSFSHNYSTTSRIGTHTLCLLPHYHKWSLLAPFFLENILFIYFWMSWVFVATLELCQAAESWGYSLVTEALRRVGLSLRWLLLLWSTGSRVGGLRWLGLRRLVAPWHVESSQTRDRTQVPCIDRWLLHCWAIREDRFCSFPRLNSLLINGWLQSMPKLLCISLLKQYKGKPSWTLLPSSYHSFFHSLPTFSNLITLQPIHSLWASNFSTLLNLLLPWTCMFSMLPNPAVTFMFFS